MGHRDFARELSRCEQIETAGTTSEYIANLSSFVMRRGGGGGGGEKGEGGRFHAHTQNLRERYSDCEIKRITREQEQKRRATLIDLALRYQNVLTTMHHLSNFINAEYFSKDFNRTFIK